MGIMEIAFLIWAIVPFAVAFDQCDVRHKFTNEQECKNKLGDSYCDKYAKLGYCVGETFENMFVQCKRSCGFCFAHDLYEVIPKKTCFPERNEKHEMLTSAQFACANDPTCSGLIESPKRRGQQGKTMYGNYSLTEREYLLCNYPQTTKNTSDTTFFKKQGPTVACANHDIKDLSSYGTMKDGGWDLKNIDEKERLVLPGQTCDKKLDRISKHNWTVQKWEPSMISTTFWGKGRVVLTFDNCNKEGDVTVVVDGVEVAKSKSFFSNLGGASTATFNVDEGTLLEIKTDDRSIIRIKDLQIDCGLSSTTLDSRPSFNGFKYQADEYCFEKTYDNDATTIEEAVRKCSNDPDCAAIEDRWGSGKPPIGLCKRHRGKRSGGGSYLLKKDVTPQHGEWSTWSNWSSCSQTCTDRKPQLGDVARKTRSRTCSNPPPANGGDNCRGRKDDVDLCNYDIPCTTTTTTMTMTTTTTTPNARTTQAPTTTISAVTSTNHPGSNWVLGESGSKCNSVCARVGGTCNSAEQSKLTSKALMEDAMLKATGQSCNVVDFRGYPGSPFYRPGAKDCFYLTPFGATSVCDGNDYGGHSPLCYCDFPWDTSTRTPSTSTTTTIPTTTEAPPARDWIVVQEGKTLAESITHCRSIDREMVSILTEEDANHFSDITKDIDTSTSEHGYIRIGLQVMNYDCQWTWIGTNQAFDPGNWFWQDNEPNGCRRNELCAQTGRGSKKWNDSKCYYKTFFVCGNKVSSSATTTTTSPTTTTTAAPTTTTVEAPCEDETKNFALGKPTGYSTAAGLHGVSGGSANGIVDGVKRGSWRNCVHTSDWKTDPYVFVDLEAITNVGSVTFNMGPGYSVGWSVGGEIRVSSEQFANVAELRAKSTICKTITDQMKNAGSYGEVTIECDEPVKGRYVSFLIPGDRKIVCFCELEVHGSCKVSSSSATTTITPTTTSTTVVECPLSWTNIDGTCFSPPRRTSEYKEGTDCNSDCRIVKKLCTDAGANLATKEELHKWLDNGGDRLGMTYGLTSTMNGNQHWFTQNLGDCCWYDGCCHHTNRFFVCAKKLETTEAPTTPTALPKCERKYNGYYSYGDCGSQNGVNSFEECCELTKQRNAASSRNIIRFSWNGNHCAFKCGGKQDNRGGSWWSSTEDISTCSCQ